MGQSIIKYQQHDISKYLKKLSIIGSLSGIFSSNKTPFLHYRVTENVYCDVFRAENLSRADVSADARLNKYGIGIKTFLEKNSNSYEKIAEFNKQQSLYSSLSDEEKINKIIELRNMRIGFTKSAYDIDTMIYHCVIRNEKGFFLFEEIMHLIDRKNVKKISHSKGNAILFTDGISEYKFDVSKSTLYKRFKTADTFFAQIPVRILENPLKELEKLSLAGEKAIINERIVVPLYSFQKENKVIFPKSGLNIWNASGRKRHPNEVYIPYPKELRDAFDTFFPLRDVPFNVVLPNGKTISMKLCQDGGKALMSNPNKALGEWILRDLLKQPENIIITYDLLLSVGVDSVSFEKIGDKYYLDFVEIGGYEEFIYENILTDI